MFKKFRTPSIVYIPGLKQIYISKPGQSLAAPSGEVRCSPSNLFEAVFEQKKDPNREVLNASSDLRYQIPRGSTRDRPASMTLFAGHSATTRANTAERRKKMSQHPRSMHRCDVATQFQNLRQNSRGISRETSCLPCCVNTKKKREKLERQARVRVCV